MQLLQGPNFQPQERSRLLQCPEAECVSRQKTAVQYLEVPPINRKIEM
jgi:hypothetical protein